MSDQQYNNEIHLKHCNVSKCHRCHPNAPILTKEEIAKLREKAKLNKNPRLRECHNKCKFCEHEINRINEIIIRRAIEQDTNEPGQKHNQQPQPPSQQRTTDLYIEMSNINNFEIKNGDNTNQGLIRALLQIFGLKNELNYSMRRIITNSLDRQALLEPDKTEAIRKQKENIDSIDNYTSHEILGPLAMLLNVTIHLCELNNPYRDTTWFSYGEENSKPERHYFLGYRKEEPNNTYYPLHRKQTEIITPPELYKQLLDPEICRKQLQTISNTNKNNPNNTRIAIWNVDSIRDYHKRSFMLQKLYDANIQIAFLQETMLTPAIQVYLKGYKIFRADSNNGRRGVAILVSNTIDCDAYATRKDNEGRFIKVKLVKQDKLITLSSVYVEPDMENHAYEVIPQDIINADILAGDMNQANTTFKKIANVYHFSSNITPLTTNQIPKQISDHPIIHATVLTPFNTKTNLIEISTLKAEVVKTNNVSITNVVKGITTNLKLSDPKITKTVDTKTTLMLNPELDQDYGIVKEYYKQKYKDQKDETAAYIAELLRANKLSKDTYIKLHGLMQLRPKAVYWNPESETEKQNIINGFSELYETSQTTDNINTRIRSILSNIWEHIKPFQQSITTMQTPFLPKSIAKDYNGFSQRTLMEIIRGENLAQSLNNLTRLLATALNNNDNILLHTTSKLLLKKKKEQIQSYKDLRGIAIMPAWIMVLDKLLFQIITPNMTNILYPNQFGLPYNGDVNTAKVNIIYNATTCAMNKIVLIDITKAFDTVNRNILRHKIEALPQSTPKQLMYDILDIYDLININISNTIIHPTRGVPQGSVFGPLFFLIYFNDILTTTANKFKEANIQAYIDDVLIQSESIETARKAFNLMEKLIRENKMHINISKCELISNDEDDTITNESTQEIIIAKNVGRYLGQDIDSTGKPTTTITQQSLGSIENLIHNSAKYMTPRIKIKLFKTYLKAKIQHLLPLIALSGNSVKSWNAIRRTIFFKILNKYTLPKESRALFRCSFYDIMVRPLIKLGKKIEKTKSAQIQYMTNALKNTLVVWKKCEPNLTTKLKATIDGIISGKSLNLEELDDIVREEAAGRMFRNRDAPLSIKKLIKLKLPNIITLLSNVPTHILEQIAKQIQQDKEGNNNNSLKHMLRKNITTIHLIAKLDLEKIPIYLKDYETPEEIIQSRHLFELKCEINLETMYTEHLDEIEQDIDNIIELNKRKSNSCPIIPNKTKIELEQARNNVLKADMEQWDTIETMIEIIEQNQADQTNQMSKVKKKHKNPNQLSQQNTIESYINNMLDDVQMKN